MEQDAYIWELRQLSILKRRDEQANEAEQVLVEKMNEVLDEAVTVTPEF